MKRYLIFLAHKIKNDILSVEHLIQKHIRIRVNEILDTRLANQRP